MKKKKNVSRERAIFSRQTRLLRDASKQKNSAVAGISLGDFRRAFYFSSMAFHREPLLVARTRPFSKRSKEPRPHLENINELPADDDVRTRCAPQDAWRLSRKGAAPRREQMRIQPYSCAGC